MHPFTKKIRSSQGLSLLLTLAKLESISLFIQTMKQARFTLFAIGFLLAILSGCTDHRSVGLTPEGRRFQIQAIDQDIYYNGLGEYKNVFTYTSSRLPDTIQQTFRSNNSIQFILQQTHAYDASGQLLASTTLNTASRFDTGTGTRQEFVYGSGGKVVVIRNYSFSIRSGSSWDHLAQIDSLRYSAQGNVVQVNGWKNGSLSTTMAIDYDQRGNPVRVTYYSNQSNSFRQRTVYEYDDKVNPFTTTLLVPAYSIPNAYDISKSMKNNPVRVKTYELAEDLTEQNLRSDITLAYEYENNLPIKITSTGQVNTPQNYVYRFSYRFL